LKEENNIGLYINIQRFELIRITSASPPLPRIDREPVCAGAVVATDTVDARVTTASVEWGTFVCVCDRQSVLTLRATSSDQS